MLSVEEPVPKWGGALQKPAPRNIAHVTKLSNSLLDTSNCVRGARDRELAARWLVASDANLLNANAHVYTGAASEAPA